MILSEKKRLPQFEILKVIAMLMVVTLHFWGYATNGRIVSFSQPATVFNYLFIEPFLILCHGGVPLFILITGYFLCDKRWGFNWKRVFSIWFYAFLYGLLGCVLLIKRTPEAETDIRSILQAILPLVGNNYWFISQYLALAVFAPFLAKMVISLSKWQYATLLMALALFGITAWFHIPFGDAVGIGKGFTLLYFIFIFLVGGYIKRFDISFKGHKPGLILAGTILACWIFLFVTETRAAGSVYIKMPCYNDLSVFVPIVLFIVAKDWKIQESPFSQALDRIAPYSLGVYLISENLFVRQHLWGWVSNILNPSFHSWLAIPMLLLVPLLVYLSCTAIDFLVKWACKSLHIEKAVEWAALQLDAISNRIVGTLAR